MGIRELSDITKKNPEPSDHYQYGRAVGFHYSKIISDKYTVTAALAYNYFLKYSFEGGEVQCAFLSNGTLWTL